MKKFLVYAAMALISLPCVAQSGRVYLDANQNGSHDKGERFVEKVAVSNGIDVLKTDKNGAFSFDNVGNGRFIFITTPNGYNSVGDFYIPYDSVNTNKSYDFGIKPFVRTASDGSHDFVHITDTEIFNTASHDDWVSGIRGYAQGQKAAFIVHTGDICYESGLNNHKKLMNDDNMGLPVRYCVGNHDYVAGKYGEEVFEKNFGPIYYSFDVGNVHYIVTPMPYGDRKVGFAKKDLVQWLENDVREKGAGKKIIAFNHDLLTSGDKFVYEADGRSVDLTANGLLAWVYGHWHINHVKMAGDVLAITTSSPDKGGIDHSVGAFRKISIDKNFKVSSHLVYPYLENRASANYIRNEKGNIELTVNAYNTASPVANVTVGKVLLQPNSDWNFSGEIALDKTMQNADLEIVVNYANGDAQRLTKTVTPANDTSVMRLKWFANLGSNIYLTSPVVNDGVVYVACVDENFAGRAKVVAYDAKSGKLLWQRGVKNSIKNSIAICEGRVFAQDTEGLLYAMDAKTGELAWEKKLRVNALPSIIEGLTAVDGVVYAGAGKGLTAIKPSGEVLWTNDSWNQNEGATSTVVVGGGAVISGSQWQGLFANDVETGKLMWKISADGMSDRGSTPAVVGGMVYLVSRASVFVVEIATGNVVMRKELPVSVDVTSSPLVMDDLVVFGTSTSGLMAVDRKTLELKWQLATNAALVYTAPYTRKPVQTVEASAIAIGDLILCGASDGILRAVDHKGKVAWSFNCGAPIFSTPVVCDDMVYISDYSGTTYGFELRK